MSRIIRQLGIYLNEVVVGRLTLDDGGLCSFNFHESYRHMSLRPVLGQQFEDDLRKRYNARSRLPRWFSNLLPEGALRQLVERDLGNQEFELLAKLGQDLPGAVRVEETASLEADAVVLNFVEDGDSESMVEDDAWHFSLAGVQLKFSAMRSDRGMTVPVSGLGGDWIVKLPHPHFPKVPENEHATMLWAKASGIDIPDIELIDLHDISGLPLTDIPLQETLAFAIRRFDRQSSGERIHMEDFAQILDLYPEQKYAKYNYETIARLTLALTGDIGLQELIRRYVFMLASGNGDAHHKNWTLLYPDGLHAVLSPAYDLVSVIQYIPGDTLSLNLGRSKSWTDMSLDTFKRLARKIDFDEDQVVQWVNSAVESTREAWFNLDSHFGYDLQAREKIGQHLASMPLFLK